ncbi:hypothetical protein ABIE18_001154 [Arthrobacter sp. 2762]
MRSTRLEGAAVQRDVAWLRAQPLQISSTHINGEWALLVDSHATIELKES